MQIRLSSILFCTFFFAFVFFCLPFSVQAATVTWDGSAADGLWETDANWDSGVVPTALDDVIIDNVTTTLSTGQTASFLTLTVGLGTNPTGLVLIGDIASGGDITIANQGTLVQSNAVAQSITGTLVIQSGGLLTHQQNGTVQAYEVDFSASNVNIQAGGSINVDARGYSGGVSSNYPGYGPGGGGGNNFSGAGGGGHGGHGGAGSSFLGGAGYCSLVDVATIGSGGGSDGHDGGYGGGLIRLNVSGTLTINGTISAKGARFRDTDSDIYTYNGGGAGGGVNLSAGTVAGTPQLFTLAGGDGGFSGGGGGGGCALISYSVSNSITSSQVAIGGATSTADRVRGGAGLLYIKAAGLNGDLFSINSVSGTAATTTPVGDDFTFHSLTLGHANFYVTSSQSLVLMNAGNPFANAANSPTGTMRVSGAVTLNTNVIASTTLHLLNGAVFTNSSTLQVAEGAGLTLDNGATLASAVNSFVSSGSLAFNNWLGTEINDLTINAGTTTFSYYSTTTPFTLSGDFTMNGGALTHAQNVDAQTHVLNIEADNITFESGSYINVDGKGYSGGIAGHYTGYGPGGGNGNNFSGAGGGGHGGDGGAGVSFAGGTAYCNINDVETIGSGGGSDGHDGGIWWRAD